MMYTFSSKTFSVKLTARLIGCLGLIFLLTLAMPSLADTISGTVTQYGGGALSGVTVRTEGEPSYSVTTGTNGAYSLTVPTGAFTVLASVSGYNPQRMPVPTGAGTVNFAMHTANTGTTLSLPAPLAWGEPPSAPTPPGDSYPIAFADNSSFPDPSAPRIADYNDCVKPNESFTLAGANFTTRTGADAGSDTTVWLWARTSTSTGTLRQAKIWKVSAGTIVATVPDDIAFGMYVVWVENSVGVSAPICLNRTKTLWVGPIDNTTYAGGTKRVFGRNLSYGHGTSQAYVYIQPASGGSFTQCSVTSVEPYAVAFTVPAGTANGNYKVFVHNGQGGVFGWGDGLDLVVQSQWVRGSGQINISSNGNDDTSQIQSAINTVSGYTNGGVVQLGSGNYILKSGISLAGNVQLKGAGKTSTTLLLEPGSINITGNRAMLSDMNVHQVYGYNLPAYELNCASSAQGVVVSNVKLDSDLGDASWQNVESTFWLGVGTELRNCDMYRGVLSQWNCWIHDNNLYGDVGPWYHAEGCASLYGWNNVFENNHAETLNWPYDPTDPNGLRRNYKWWDYYYKVWAKRLALCYCKSSYVAHNNTLNVGVNDNRGEIILFHGHWSNWCGQVLSNSGLTMTVRTDGTVFGQNYTIPNAYGNQLTAGSNPVPDQWDYWALDAGRDVIIIAGTGAGQSRLVAWNGGVPASNQIMVDSPWTVQPDSTSVILLSGTWSNNIVYANDLSGFPVNFSFDPAYDYAQTGYASNGIQFDGSSYHNVTEGNISRRTNYGRNILGISGGPTYWTEMRDEQVIDANTFGYRIQQLDVNPLGPVLFGNAYRNCSGNVIGSSQSFGALGQGEGAVIENMNVTGSVGYRVGNASYGSTGSPTLYRNGTVTVNSSPNLPAYIEGYAGGGLLIGNTYSGASQPYSYNTGSFNTGATSYSMLAPLYRVAKFSANAGSGVLSAVQIPIANGGTADMPWAVISGSSWITASIQANGTVTAENTSGSLSITPDATGMSVGRHWGVVTVYTTSGSFYKTVQAIKIGVEVDITSTTQVAAPMFNPMADVAGSHSVTISTTTSGATIRYTTDGTTPTSSVGTVYGGSFTVNQGTVLKAIAYKAGKTDSVVTNIAVAAPTFSLASGAYAGPHSVTISTITTGATIRYTTDGTLPSQSNGTVYSSSISIGSTCTLQAIAYKTGMADSDVANSPYTIVNQTWSLAGDFSSVVQGNNGWFYGIENYSTGSTSYMGLFNAPASSYTGNYPDYAMDCSPAVRMWGGWGGGICLSTATTNLSKYPIGQNIATLAANKVAMNAGVNNGDKVKARYLATMDGDYTYSVTFSRPSNALNGVLVNTGDIVANTKTMLGSETYITDTTSSQSYSGTQHLNVGQFLEFVVDTLGQDGLNHYWDNDRLCLVQVDATITAGGGGGGTVVAPSFSPGAGTYSSTQSVTISTTTGGASIRYTTNGTDPTSTTGTVYSSPVSIASTCTLKAIAYKSGMTDSTVTSGLYTIMAACAAPTFTPAAGTYTGTQSVTLDSTTSGASIRYTTDGTTPSDTAGTVYSSAISIDRSLTLKAIAYKTGMSNSTVTSGGYTINCVAPTFGPVAGTYTGTQSVTISTTTSGASIRYTTDGTTPSDTVGTVYSSAVSIPRNLTLKAIAYKTNLSNSTVTSGGYTINCVAPTFSPAAGNYSGAQSVTISSTTSGASIRYTTDGTTPSDTVGTVYSSAVSISASCMLQAVAYKTNMGNSSVTSGSYTITVGWSLAGDFSSTAQGNRGWYYKNTWGSNLGTSASWWGGGGFDQSYNMWTSAPVIMWGGWPGGLFYTTQSTGWGKYPMSWGQIGTLGAGVVGFIPNSNNGQSTAARWVAPADGDYTYNVTFSAPASSGDLNGVYVDSSLGRLSGTEQYLSATNTSYSYSGTQHLTTGQWFEFVQDTQNSSNVDTYWDNYELPVTLVSATITGGGGGGGTVAAPTFSPAAGNYSSAQSVTISTTTNGASIRYTTDGTTPSDTVGTVYSSAVSVPVNMTLKAIAYKSGMTNSNVTSGAYTINCVAPTFNPAEGAYTSAQSVTITTTTGGASIRYTTDGTTPSDTVGTVYSSAVSVPQNLTLKAIAYKTGMSNSAVMSGVYTISCVAPTFSPVAGTYTGTQSVTISSTTGGASIRYTTDGTTPSDTVGTVYSSAVSIPQNLTLKAIAYKANMSNSTVTSGAYNIQVAAPTFNPSAGTYTGTQGVTISSTTSGATIRYTTDGTTPTSTTGTVYSSAVSVPQNLTLKAIAYKTNMTDSSVTSGSYIINCAAPTFNPAAGTYAGTQSVTISCTTGGVTIRYTTDGTVPTSTVGTIYTGPVSISTSCTLKAIAYKTGMGDSTVTSGAYTISVAAPTFSVAAGTYYSVQSVTISTTTGGASIRYTTDGTTPTSTTGTLYSSAVSVPQNLTLKAIAYKSGMGDSTVTSAAYVIGWSLAGDFSSTAQGNRGWYYRDEWGNSLGTSASWYTGTSLDYQMDCIYGAAVAMYGGWGGGLFYTTQSTGWTKYPMSYNQIGTFAAGVIGMIPGSNDGQSTAARWVAPANGNYTYSVTFSAPASSGDLNGVYVNSSVGRLSGTEQYLSTTNTSYTYSGTQYLTTGQWLEFVQDTQNSSNVNTRWDNYELPVTLVTATISGS